MDWKRALLIGVGWGLGTAVGLALIVGGFLWYENRPKPPVPPKPWNASAIKAEYDFVSTEADKDKQNVIVFITRWKTRRTSITAWKMVGASR